MSSYPTKWRTRGPRQHSFRDVEGKYLAPRASATRSPRVRPPQLGRSVVREALGARTARSLFRLTPSPLLALALTEVSTLVTFKLLEIIMAPTGAWIPPPGYALVPSQTWDHGAKTHEIWGYPFAEPGGPGPGYYTYPNPAGENQHSGSGVFHIGTFQHNAGLNLWENWSVDAYGPNAGVQVQSPYKNGAFVSYQRDGQNFPWRRWAQPHRTPFRVTLPNIPPAIPWELVPLRRNSPVGDPIHPWEIGEGRSRFVRGVSVTIDWKQVTDAVADPAGAAGQAAGGGSATPKIDVIETFPSRPPKKTRETKGTRTKAVTPRVILGLVAAATEALDFVDVLYKAIEPNDLIRYVRKDGTVAWRRPNRSFKAKAEYVWDNLDKIDPNLFLEAFWDNEVEDREFGFLGKKAKQAAIALDRPIGLQSGLWDTVIMDNLP